MNLEDLSGKREETIEKLKRRGLEGRKGGK